ncbi:MAG TPA: glycerophosphodiester phosphodiesterase family protein, partial [Solirubrobacterales bacterium]|nr:glycerophosphodiester phosphodiesterase family protein [Solirubrobacterales bacterium]
MGRFGIKAALAGLASLLVIAHTAVTTAPAQASPYVHAHRGGSLVTGAAEQRPRFPENTMPVFRDAAARGFVLELDVRLTADRVPVVIHDITLDRTTDCEGPVESITFADLRSRCEADLLGTDETVRKLGPRDRQRARVPSLQQVLRLAKRERATLNVEVKNVPTDSDFDPSPTFVRAVANAIRDSGVPPSRLIVQSF